MSACQDLVNAVNAVIVGGKKFFVDIAPDCAVLSNPGSTQSLVQLSAGGDAILSVPSSPSISGRLLRLVVAGNLHLEGDYNSGLTLSLKFGTTTGGTTLGNSTVNGVYPQVTQNQPFLAELICIWESVSQKFYTRSYSGLNVNWPNGAPNDPISVSSQTGLQFCISAYYTGSADNRSATVTQFSIEAE